MPYTPSTSMQPTQPNPDSRAQSKQPHQVTPDTGASDQIQYSFSPPGYTVANPIPQRKKTFDDLAPAAQASPSSMPMHEFTRTGPTIPSWEDIRQLAEHVIQYFIENPDIYANMELSDLYPGVMSAMELAGTGTAEQMLYEQNSQVDAGVSRPSQALVPYTRKSTVEQISYEQNSQFNNVGASRPPQAPIPHDLPRNNEMSPSKESDDESGAAIMKIQIQTESSTSAQITGCNEDTDMELLPQNSAIPQPPEITTLIGQANDLLMADGITQEGSRLSEVFTLPHLSFWIP
ncbi:hypothetical protein BD779DRAFT_1681784 [Infundibulicybe gibba]|nr:hypothetical protein BD779DRAFT_1681784 [Infundibulicybe gibba]